MDHANTMRVDADVADFTARVVRVLRALVRARRYVGCAEANRAAVGGLDISTYRGDIRSEKQRCAQGWRHVR